ncbi:uncharacterized protein F5147DRAFT_759024 [Suillus discolor]|uniref:Uncharacterized protein n=1 Tax=Suillus discolor TaxID=1912936 RepID=A0A9P7FEW7_9AGAM|nr:uncharacterized protein F5147DRAFT_759024 [Suillus discolor]KAG2113740.1 hypothetical protein F5147DRAFT_759024 [Suillus discolor]
MYHEVIDKATDRARRVTNAKRQSSLRKSGHSDVIVAATPTILMQEDSCKPSTPHSAIKAAEGGKSTRRRHAHLHTREEVGIAVKIVQDLEASFGWAPPLSINPRDADNLLVGPESISYDDNIAAEFAAPEELKKTEEVRDINEVKVLDPEQCWREMFSS